MTKLYSATFPVHDSKNLDDLAKVLSVWISGSPHRAVAPNELRNIGNDGFQYHKGKTEIQAARHVEGKNHLYGLRLLEPNGKGIRTTEVTGRKSKDDFEVTVSHEYNAFKVGTQSVDVAKPRIVNDILEKLGGGYDGLTIRMKREPHWFNDDDLPFVAEIVTNQTQNKLPIIYVSKDGRGMTAVNPHRLAYLLGGMAHVLVEPTRRFSFDLREKTNGRNTYNGAIGIYWPNDIRRLILPDASRDIVSDIYNTIRDQNLLTLVPREMVFDGIKSLQTSKRLEELKRTHSTTEEETLKLAIDEIDRRDKEIADLRAEVGTLQSYAQRGTQFRTIGGDILRGVQINELYAGELKDFVLETLENSLNNVHSESRREDTLKAVLAANKMTGNREEVIQGLRDVFTGAQNLNSKMENALRSLGFEIEKGGKHAQVYVPGNDNRKYTIALTPSDHRSRKNECSGIKNKLL